MVKKYIPALLFQFLVLGLWAQADGPKKVLHMKVQGDIDPRTNRYTELAFEKAAEMQVDYVVLELDTYGGALTDADEIRTRILNYTGPVYAFINKDAASAGALISIACDSIYMAKGSSIGAATVVSQDGAAAPDKYQSYMRSIMRSTAEAKGRDPRIAEAMVDEDLAVDSITQAGKVLTFSVSEAIKYGYCEAEVSGLPEIMQRAGVGSYEVTEFQLGASEKVIAFFLNPFISGILILIIIGGIYFELQTPGVGFPILASLVAAILYFTPYYLNGLAENWEILLFAAGLVLIGLEIFVIPGFGVAGISGIVLTIGSLTLVMINNDALDFSFVKGADLIKAFTATMGGLFGAMLLLFVGGVRFTNSRMFQRIALQQELDPEKGYTSSSYKTKSLVGKRGVAYTVLRPSGKVEIEGEIYDAYTRGNYTEQGSTVEVISDEGTSLKVKEVK